MIAVLFFVMTISHQWQKFEDANHEPIWVDAASVSRDVQAGKVIDGEVVVYLPFLNMAFDPRLVRRWWFNCRGQLIDRSGNYGPIEVRPNSVENRIAILVCGDK